MKIKRFIFEPNGEEVIEVASVGLRGFIPASVPVEVLELWLERLASHARRRIGRLRHAERRWKRRRLTPVRVHMRRRRVEGRVQLPVRSWNPVPRR
jgi:hypothetical protein